MRLACLILVALVAGCLGPIQIDDAPKTEGPGIGVEDDAAAMDPEPAGDAANSSSDRGERQLGSYPSDSNRSVPIPPPLHWEGSFTGGADAGALTGTPCGALSSCDQRSFTIDGTFDLEATLSWGLATNDFDLYLFQDGKEVSQDGIDEPGDPPSTGQVLVHQALASGDYELWVVGSLMVMDSYALDAAFAIPPAAPEPPRPMHWSGQFNQVAIPAAGPWTQCGVPLTACFSHDFSIEGKFDLEATLSWDLPTNDLDLYLYRHLPGRNYTEVNRAGVDDGMDLPATQQVLRQPGLAPGDYRLLVVPQHGVRTEYELDAVFSSVTR